MTFETPALFDLCSMQKQNYISFILKCLHLSGEHSSILGDEGAELFLQRGITEHGSRNRLFFNLSALRMPFKFPLIGNNHIPLTPVESSWASYTLETSLHHNKVQSNRILQAWLSFCHHCSWMHLMFLLSLGTQKDLRCHNHNLLVKIKS